MNFEQNGSCDRPKNVITQILQSLYKFISTLADIIWTMKQQVKQLQNLREKVSDPQNNGDNKPDLLMDITKLLYNLVRSTFIIEKQPPQV